MAQATNRQQLGEKGENEAVRFLETRGFAIIERNWRPGKIGNTNHRDGQADGAMRGEIDIIARSGKILCFIEVKARTSSERGAPQEAVTPSKQRQISRLANAYISIFQLHDTPCRFDVVEVWLQNNGESQIALHQNAFDYQAVSPRSRSPRIF